MYHVVTKSSYGIISGSSGYGRVICTECDHSRRERLHLSMKRQVVQDLSDGEEDNDDEDDIGRRQPAKKGRRGLVLSDDEDE